MSIRSILSIFRSKASDKVSRTDDPGVLAHQLGFTPINITYGASFEPLVLVKRNDTFAADRAPQHPLAPERDPPELNWDRWSQMQRETFRRGWSFARFAARSHPDRMACLFGIVRGAWGIAVMDFHICGTGGSAPLNAITHLPSGMGCGLFVDQESAATACDIAARLGDDWEASVDPAAPGAHEAIARLHQAWAAAGITRCATHAHHTADTETAPLAIWFQDYSTVVAGRPEGKLS